MLYIIMFCKKVNTIKAYQIIICLTNKNMMNSGKFTGGSNNKCYPNFILQSLDKMLIMNLEFG